MHYYQISSISLEYDYSVKSVFLLLSAEDTVQGHYQMSTSVDPYPANLLTYIKLNGRLHWSSFLSSFNNSYILNW